MYNKFINGFHWLSKLLGKDMLLYIALGVLGLLFLYELAMTVTILVIRRKHHCLCKFVQINIMRRFAACTIAWAFAFFAFITLLQINNAWDMAFMAFDNFLLPVAFLLAFHIIELLFSAITNCNCRRSTKCEIEKHHPEPKHEPKHEPEPIKKKEQNSLNNEAPKRGRGRPRVSHETKSQTTKPVKSQVPEGFGPGVTPVSTQELPKITAEISQNEEKIPVQRVLNTYSTLDATQQTQSNRAEGSRGRGRPKGSIGSKALADRQPKITSARRGRPKKILTDIPVSVTRDETFGYTPPKSTETFTPNITPTTAPQSLHSKRGEASGSSGTLARTPEFYAELAEKIEKQRLRAQMKADKMDAHGRLESYSNRTQEALQESAELAQVAKEITEREKEEELAQKNAELQRRMEILRQSVAPTTQTTTRTTTTYTDYRVSARGQKSISELKREQDGLKLQYQTLQDKLDEIKFEKKLPPEYRSTSSAKQGYYSTPENFERTGDRAQLSKISNAKYDEEEIRAALAGLRQAIADLQAQIDSKA
jgi:hypothetical protein